MHIVNVRADAFGPIRDGELQLDPGFTLVAGPNESGKSSWHAAVTTALTGRRKGGSTNDRRDFERRHRPWTFDGWSVECTVQLADGRRVHVRHDLDLRRSQAFDHATGREITDELTTDGAVDLSQLIGLDRATLPLVASVAQADILKLAAASADKQAASRLREFLQQATSSRATGDTTAEHAISTLTAFGKDRIGSPRANSPKPLQQAVNAVETAEHRRVEARDRWHHHRAQGVELERLEAKRASVAGRVTALQLASARQRLARAQRRLCAAEELGVLDPEPEVGAGSGLERRVVEALAALDGQPRETRVDRAAISDLERAIDALPKTPVGDIDVHPLVVDATQALQRVETGAELHEATAPTPPELNDSVPTDVSANELRRLAAELERPLPDQPTALRAQIDSYEHEVAGRPDPRMRWVGGVVALVIAVALYPVSVVAALAALAVGALGLGWLSRSPSMPSIDLDELRGGVALAESRYAEAADRQLAATRAVAALGLAADPVAIRSAAVGRERADEHSAALDQHRRVGQQHRQSVQAARQAVADALVGRGAILSGPLSDDIDRYRRECRQRREATRAASHRPQLERELQLMRSTARDAEAARQARLEAEQRLVHLAAEAGIEADDSSAGIDTVVAELRRWLQQVESSRQQADEHRRRVGELRSLAGDRSVDESRQLCEQQAAAVTELEGALPAGLEVPRQLDAAQLERSEAELASIDNEVAARRGALAQAERTLGDMAALDEAHARAVAEYERISRLRGLVKSTIGFLNDAKTKVHRTVAPQLAGATNDRLKAVSGGRYKEIRVDPEDLSVQVRHPDGSMRLAGDLSYGTAEQIYLLLRAAISEVVSPTGEACPLILDDVTVHADDDRTEALLDVLLEISRERQVVLFSQEDAVVSWARRHSVSVIDLPPV